MFLPAMNPGFPNLLRLYSAEWLPCGLDIAANAEPKWNSIVPMIGVLKNLPSRVAAHVQYVTLGRPDLIVFFGFGIGDDLLCTTIFHELKLRGLTRIVMISKRKELFVNNPDVPRVRNWSVAAVERLKHWRYPACIPFYSTCSPVSKDIVIMPEENILTAMCRKAGITGRITLRPYIFLHAHEVRARRLFTDQVAIQSCGLGDMLNKEWFFDRFQRVCNRLLSKMNVVQLGLATDPPLAGALDLRGKTTLREAAAILANSRVFVGLDGFLMHLARAVDCRSVIVYGGRTRPSVIGYAVNENIVGITA